MIVCLATWAAVIRQRPAFCLACRAGVAGHNRPLWACVYLVADLSMIVCLAPWAAVIRHSPVFCNLSALLVLQVIGDHVRACVYLMVCFRPMWAGATFCAGSSDEACSRQGWQCILLSMCCNLVQVILVAFFLVLLNWLTFDYVYLLVSVLCTSCARCYGFCCLDLKPNLLLLNKIYSGLSCTAPGSQTMPSLLSGSPFGHPGHCSERCGSSSHRFV